MWYFEPLTNRSFSMIKYKKNIFIVLFLALFSNVAISQESKISISGSSFNPLGGGHTQFWNGCYWSRLNDGQGDDGNMYAGVDIPIGASITRITAHFQDWANQEDTRPKLSLRKHNGFSGLAGLAEAQIPFVTMDYPGYYKSSADVIPHYVVQEDDFFELMFVVGESFFINSYHICGADIYYQLAK